jgi:formylmethanofuran dehydrogenase subunit E
MNIGNHTYEEFIDKVKSFHGSIAPGIIAGGIMVDIAQKNLPEGEFFDVICETDKCLPDAVQLLTPCTIGNGWLRIVSTSRYAMTFYNKYTGDGIRVYLNADKLENWDEIRSWFLREKPKHDQDLHLILKQFHDAGAAIYSIQRVRISPDFMEGTKKKHSPIVMCPSCNEAYSSDLGDVCPACRGKVLYKIVE